MHCRQDPGKRAVSNQVQDSYSIVSFSNRSGEDQKHGVLRPFQEKLPIEQPGSEDPFFVDIQRIKGSREWRRLSGVYQFVVGQQNSKEPQNRITHTEDVQNVGERIGRGLKLDRHSIDLVRSIATIHDIGHLPFGHWGEKAAQECLKPFGRTWNHDAAGLRVVTEWSNRGISHEGLNLTLDTLEGLAKRYWRYIPGKSDHFHHDLSELPQSIIAIDKKFGLHLDKQNHVEGQIAAISDWIAFTATDIEDALRMGRMTAAELCEHFPPAKKIYETIQEQLHDVPRVKTLGGRSGSLKRESDSRQASLAKLLADAVKTMLIDDVVTQTKQNIKREVAAGRLKTADDVRNLDGLVVAYSPEMLKHVQGMQDYSYRLRRARTSEADGTLQKMVEFTIQDIVDGKLALPKSWQLEADQIAKSPEPKAALTELACTYMTCVMDDQDVISNIRQNHQELEINKLFRQITPARSGRVSGQSYTQL
jgi:dGTPase